MTNPIIKPTVGRVVWYRLRDKDDIHMCRFNTQGESRPDPLTALIVGVETDRLVNLIVFDTSGQMFPRKSVPLVQDGEPVSGCCAYCEWMPFQKGQAAKTEAAEKNASTASGEYRQRSQREQLEYALVSGAAPHLAHVPDQAGRIAQGIKSVLDALHPQPVLLNPHTGMLRDARDVASDPQAKLCVKLGESLKAAAASRSVTSVTYRAPDSLEREIHAKASIAPRVTPADIEAEITHTYYLNVGECHRSRWPDPSAADETHPSIDLLTICVLVLKNGFTVTGESACVSPENFNAEIGRSVARENAMNKIWPLLGFRLRDVLARPVLTEADAAADRADAPRPDNPNA